MEDILVPLGFFAIVPIIVWTVSSARRKSHEATTKVIKSMVEKGETVTPETVRALGIRPKPKHSDLRTGLILMALAVATILFGGVIDEPEAQKAFGGLAMFPLLIGAVYTGLWAFITRKDEPA